MKTEKYHFNDRHNKLCLGKNFCHFIIVCMVVSLPIQKALSQQVKRTSEFIGSIGVSAHINETHSAYNNFSTVIKPRLQELGILRIRTDTFSVTNNLTQDRLNQLANIGIKSTIIMDPRGLSEASNAVEIAKTIPKSIEAIEGPNELDINPFTYKGEGFPNGLRKFQDELFNAIKSDPATSKLPVLAPSIAGIDNASILGKVSCGMNNIHNYYKGWIPGHPFITDNIIPKIRVLCGSTAPFAVTETGYHNAVNHKPNDSWYGYPEDVTAKYIPRILLNNFNLGIIKRTFIYQLIDGNPDASLSNREEHFGLIRNDGTPKPAFNAIKNLISILRGSNSDPINSFNFSLTGDLSNVRQTLLQKDTNVSFLILWQELESYNAQNKQAIIVPNRSLKLVLDASFKDISLYHPVDSVNSIQRYQQQKEIALDVPDHPLVIRLTRN
jgi:hypothetical protein